MYLKLLIIHGYSHLTLNHIFLVDKPSQDKKWRENYPLYQCLLTGTDTVSKLIKYQFESLIAWNEKNKILGFGGSNLISIVIMLLDLNTIQGFLLR
jgi:hypothetical protein